MALDEDNLIAVMSCVQTELARKKVLDIHSKARDSIHKYTQIELSVLCRFLSCWDLAIVLVFCFVFVLNDPLCGHVFVTEEHATMRNVAFLTSLDL